MAHSLDTSDAIISEAIIDQIVQKIVDQVNPLQVILFGSYARGMPATDSRSGFVCSCRVELAPS